MRASVGIACAAGGAIALVTVMAAVVPARFAAYEQDAVEQRGRTLLRAVAALVAADRVADAQSLAGDATGLVYCAVVRPDGSSTVLAYDGTAGIAPPIDRAAGPAGRTAHGLWHAGANAGEPRVLIGMSTRGVVAVSATARWLGLGVCALAFAFAALGRYWLRRRWRPSVERAVLEAQGLASSLRARAELASSASDQAAEVLDHSCAAVEGIFASAHDIAGRAAEVLRNAEATNQGSYSVVDHLINLSEVSENVGALLERISRLAVKTDLLALNASLEATRAGEHGRGFALVAAEMRRLAAEVGNAAREIAQLMDEIKTATQTVAVASNESAMSSDDTTGSARDIADITRLQRESTEEALRTLERLAEVVNTSLGRERAGSVRDG